MVLIELGRRHPLHRVHGGGDRGAGGGGIAGLRGFAARRREILPAALVLLPVCVRLGLVVELGWRPLVERLVRNSIVAAGEEYVFRGFVWEQLTLIDRRPGFVIPVSAASFTLVHVPRVIVGGESLWSLVAIAALGVFLAVLKKLSGGLFVPTVAHLLFNVT